MKNLERWAEVRETSLEVAQAIHDVAGGDFDIMSDLWQNPTPEQSVRILRAAFSFTDEDELCWGEEIVRRAGK